MSGWAGAPSHKARKAHTSAENVIGLMADSARAPSETEHNKSISFWMSSRRYDGMCLYIYICVYAVCVCIVLYCINYIKTLWIFVLISNYNIYVCICMLYVCFQSAYILPSIWMCMRVCVATHSARQNKRTCFLNAHCEQAAGGIPTNQFQRYFGQIQTEKSPPTNTKSFSHGSWHVYIRVSSYNMYVYERIVLCAFVSNAVNITWMEREHGLYVWPWTLLISRIFLYFLVRFCFSFIWWACSLFILQCSIIIWLINQWLYIW